VTLVLDGPARAIFAAKLPGVRALSELPALAGFDWVLCGSSASAPLERRVVRAARTAGVRCTVWLDHWGNYPMRFELDGESVLPDELWVSDEHAARLARATVAGPRVRVQGNPFLEDAAEEIRALGRPPGPGERVLFVADDESPELLRRYLERLAAAPPHAVRFRPHPAYPDVDYAPLLGEFAGRLAISLSAGTSLVEDCAWADTVAGSDTMALAVALVGGRRVVSIAAEPTLPFVGIERLDLGSAGGGA
jgi:hypothetical protein